MSHKFLSTEQCFRQISFMRKKLSGAPWSDNNAILKKKLNLLSAFTVSQKVLSA